MQFRSHSLHEPHLLSPRLSAQHLTSQTITSAQAHFVQITAQTDM